jgi:tetratricopeptide (TPR) repeat protein
MDTASGALQLVVWCAWTTAIAAAAAHQGAVLVRAWRGGGRLLVIVTLALAAAVVALTIWGARRGPGAIDVLHTGVGVVTAVHVAWQAHRFARVLVARAGRVASWRALLASSALLAAALVVTTQLGPSVPLAHRLHGLPEGIKTATALVFVGLAVVSAAVATQGMPARSRLVVALQPAVLVALAFVASASITDGSGGAAGALPILAIALGGTALGFVHALQALWMCFQAERGLAGAASVAGSEAGSTFDPIAGRGFDPIAWGAVVLGLGAGLVLAAPWTASRILALDPTTVIVTFGGALALQHVIVDLFAFRSTDHALWQALARPPADVTDGRDTTSNVKAVAFVCVVTAVLVVAAVPLASAVLTRPGASVQQIDVADRLHPQDATFSIAFARAMIAEADLPPAIDAVRGVVDSGAYAPAAHVLALQTCGRRQRDLSRCLARVPSILAHDSDVVVLLAMDTLARGDAATAVEMLRAPLERRPDDREALAIAGLAEAQLGDVAAARRHLDRALAPPSSEADVLVPARPTLPLPRLLRAGIAQARLMADEKRHDAALAVIERVLRGAVVADDPDAALLALVERAALYEAADDAAEALSSYQRALRVAPHAEEPIAEAEAWIDYAVLLRRSGATLEARYACVLMASRALESVPASDRRRVGVQATIDRGRADVEAELDPQVAEAVRADVEKAAEQALALSYGAQEPARPTEP